MAQEFTIKSQTIEDKINQLLPSQGGFQPGVDFSASTMVIPIVDLTETAEGSSLRQDLQTALDFATTYTNVTNATTTLVSTTGFYRCVGFIKRSSGNASLAIQLTDGVTTKDILRNDDSSNVNPLELSFDFIVYLSAGISLQAVAPSTGNINISTRQVADIKGNLTNPNLF